MKTTVRYLSVKQICNFPFSRKISESGNSSGEYFKQRLVSALQSDATLVCIDLDTTISAGASWYDEIFGTMDSVQKELVQNKLYVKTQYEFLRGLIELRLGTKLIKHYEIQKEVELCKLKQKKSKRLLNRIFRKIFRLK